MVETRKRRKTWTHEFEEAIFTPEEMFVEDSSLSYSLRLTLVFFDSAQQTAPQRRKVYLSSLEAHIDALHAQLLSYVVS